MNFCIYFQNQQNNYHQYELNNERPAAAMSPIGKFNHDKILKILSTTNYERNNNLQPTLNVPQMPFSLPDLRQDIYKKSIQDNLLQNTYKYTGNNGEFTDNNFGTSHTIQNHRWYSYKNIVEALAHRTRSSVIDSAIGSAVSDTWISHRSRYFCEQPQYFRIVVAS